MDIRIPVHCKGDRKNRSLIAVKKKFLMRIILVAIAVSIPIAAAAASQAPPFITIDPIGNHTIGDVFFINGTTNLAVFNESIDLQIETGNMNPGGYGYYFSSIGTNTTR